MSKKEIYLAGGCFWGVEAYVSRIPGVLETTVGYANGHTERPTYREVCTHTTGHAETLKAVYDPPYCLSQSCCVFSLPPSTQPAATVRARTWGISTAPESITPIRRTCR